MLPSLPAHVAFASQTSQREAPVHCPATASAAATSHPGLGRHPASHEPLGCVAACNRLNQKGTPVPFLPAHKELLEELSLQFSLAFENSALRETVAALQETAVHEKEWHAAIAQLDDLAE